MFIDVYAHLVPRKYWDEAVRRIGIGRIEKYVSREALGVELTRTLWNMDERFRIMDKYNGLTQILVPSGPTLELIASPDQAVELAKLYNDEMASLVSKYPDRFLGAVAFLPMNDPDAALKETDRAISQLGFRGVLLQTPLYANSPDVTKPIDIPELMPLYEKMSEYDLPIWLHPKREFSIADYTTEESSKYLIHQMFGWPYESTVAMSRLVYSGVLESYPRLKFITHHSGGMVPFLAGRIVNQCEWYKVGLNAKFLQRLEKAPIEYFRRFYADTAVYCNPSALMCSHAFFGADHLLFGTDMPYDSELGDRSLREILSAIGQMDIPEREKKQILEGNAKSILKLPLS
jgi:aminocarboxymuconate-semialdehyde decarboxylase